MSQAISNLPVGAKVKDTNTKYDGTTIAWIVVAKNHSGYPSNSATLLSEKALRSGPFDTYEKSGSSYADGGNPRYSLSNMRQWANKSGKPWYVAQHSDDQAPSYSDENGFLSNFSSQMLAALLPTPLTCAYNYGSQAVVTDSFSDRLFILSAIEMGYAATNSDISDTGSKLAYFDSGSGVSTKRIAYDSSGTAVRQATRTRRTSSQVYIKVIMADGSINHDRPANAGYRFRPACNLSSTTLVSDNADSSGYYTLVWNTAPSTPPAITVPSTIRSGESAIISWLASADPDGNSITYKLECAINGGNWAEIYSGVSTQYSHAITSSMTTVQYRVRAVDSNSASSGYATSTARTVVHNVAPTISGSNSNLGTKTAPFTQTFSVNDTDTGDTLTVKTYLDSTLLQTISSAVRGQTYSIVLTSAQFYKLANGSHTLKIVCNDGQGHEVTRTYTFSRSITAIKFVTTEDTGSTMADTITVALQTTATVVTIRACNNHNDASPAWETIHNGALHTFANAEKTAETWKVAVEVTATPPSGGSAKVTGLTAAYHLSN